MDSQTADEKLKLLMDRLATPVAAALSPLVDDQILRTILSDWGEAMVHLQESALQVEADPTDDQAFADIKRTLHSIKGDSAACGLTGVSENFHAAEDLLDAFMEREQCPTDPLLELKDWLQAFLDGIAAGTVTAAGGERPGKDSDRPANPDVLPGTSLPLGSAQEITPAGAKGPMRILIADDDATSCSMLQAILTKWGYRVTCVGDGQAAWEIFQEKEAPQMAVLDWVMPQIDGTTLCRMLREQERKEPLYLILLTSRDQSGDIVKGLEAGADDYIAKPYDTAELKARVNTGRRLIAYQNEVRHREKLQGVLEMAGAVCHELNQPLQSVSGFTEMLMFDLEENSPHAASLQKIKQGVDRIGELTRKIMRVTRYQSKPYLESRIVDIDKASQ